MSKKVETKTCKKCGKILKKHYGKFKCANCELDTLMKTEEWRKLDNILKRIDISVQKSPLSKMEEGELLKTHTVLDTLFGGGIRRGQLIEFYGEYGSSKTQILFTLLVESKGKVIYIDGEKTFSQTRIKQICEARGKNWKELDKRLFYFQPKNWKEQIAIPHQLADAEDIDLIIVDSLLCHFRSSKEFLGRQTLTNRQGIIRTHLADLRELAQRYNCIVLITNQVYDVPDAKPFTPMYRLQVGVGGHSVYHVPDVRIYLRKAKDPKRVARIMDSSELANLSVAFQIDEFGISDIEEEDEPKEEKPEETEETTPLTSEVETETQEES